MARAPTAKRHQRRTWPVRDVRPRFDCRATSCAAKLSQGNRPGGAARRETRATRSDQKHLMHNDKIRYRQVGAADQLTGRGRHTTRRQTRHKFENGPFGKRIWRGDDFFDRRNDRTYRVSGAAFARNAYVVRVRPVLPRTARGGCLRTGRRTRFLRDFRWVAARTMTRFRLTIFLAARIRVLLATENLVPAVGTDTSLAGHTTHERQGHHSPDDCERTPISECFHSFALIHIATVFITICPWRRAGKTRSSRLVRSCSRVPRASRRIRISSTGAALTGRNCVIDLTWRRLQLELQQFRLDKM
jgi:hypothetical protein